MTVEDFLASAYASAEIISDPALKLGERIHRSIIATREAVAMNTNLGTVLLCAPIATAVDSGKPENLQSSISNVIVETGVSDAEAILEAIRIAAPSGLSKSELYDVCEPASADILTIMKEAQTYDMIARQYSNGFGEIFDFGFEQIEEGTAAGLNDSDVVTKVYLAYLSRFLDTHIVRQHGKSVAGEIRKSAGQLYNEFQSVNSAEAMHQHLLRVDADWKTNDINPGTSADLTVATLFAYKIEISAKQAKY